MRVLVTGHAGFAGSHLARSLRADGREVAGFDIEAGDDIRDRDRVRSAVRSARPDQVFHLAAVARPAEALKNPFKAAETNAAGALNLLGAFREHAPDARVLLAGSSDEYGHAGRVPDDVLTEESAALPDGPYAASKLAATALGLAYARSYGLRVVITRACWHTGPGSPAGSAVSDFARKIVAVERGEAGKVTHGDLSRRIDLTDVRDTMRAYRLAIDCEPGIYNVCSERQVTLASVMKMLVSLSEAQGVPLERDPAFGTASAIPGPSYSAAKLHRATGWKPEIPLSQTLGDLLDYWRAR